ncbi:MAG TPA: RNA pseudouridine synthase [Pseudomonadales bacterium]|nr:RNA pseudouridine synthase [Pseudomonadales bacterium]
MPVILYRSAELLAIDKPSGISLLADRSGAACLWDEMREYLRADGLEPLSVHRIDKGTSGVLLVALTRETQSRLTQAFARRDVRKFYVARVVGDPRLGGRSGMIDLPLAKGRKSRYRVAGPRERIGRERNRWYLASRPDGHPSVSRLRCIAADRDHSLLALQPITGRTHQLRVHLAWIGHPICGDRLYGRPDDPAQRWPRLALHCHRIVVDGLTITAPLPRDELVPVVGKPRARGGKPERRDARTARQREQRSARDETADPRA